MFLWPAVLHKGSKYLNISNPLFHSSNGNLDCFVPSSFAFAQRHKVRRGQNPCGLFSYKIRNSERWKLMCCWCNSEWKTDTILIFSVFCPSKATCWFTLSFLVAVVNNLYAKTHSSKEIAEFSFENADVKSISYCKQKMKSQLSLSSDCVETKLCKPCTSFTWHLHSSCRIVIMSIFLERLFMWTCSIALNGVV